MELNAKIKQKLEQPALRISLVIVASIVVIVAGLCIGDAALYSNKVHKGVKVSDVQLGGETKSEALVELNRLSNVLERKTITITYKNNTWKANPRELDARIDTKKTIDKAFAIGRRGKFFKVVGDRIGLWFKPRNVEPVFTYDKNKLDEFIKGITKKVNRPAEDGEIKIVNSRAMIASSKDGRQVKKKVLVDRLLKAFAYKNSTSIELPVVVQKPDITEQDLSDVRDTVKQIIKAPVVLRYRDKKWEIPVTQISEWLEFNKVREGRDWGIDIKFDKDEMTGYLEQQTKEISTEPKDAEFKIEGDKVAIVPGNNGIEVDLDKACNDVFDASKTEDSREVMLVTETTKPKLTTEDAGKMGIKEKVSSYTTFFNGGQTSRVHNIQTLANSLDGNIVAPNETFSFNGTIGPRTAAKGYREAPAIINGELVPSLGGGVCQVATTLFNVIFFGGYEVVERHNHSFFISHYPTGRDATVSWDGPDLKFKNNTSAYVLIKTRTTSGSITISFYSTNQNIKVEYTTSGPSNYKSAPTKRVDDPTLAKGVTKVEERGIAGRDVSVYRIVYKNGKVAKKDTFFSRYPPGKSVVRIGTREVAAPPAPGATPPVTAKPTIPPTTVPAPIPGE